MTDQLQVDDGQVVSLDYVLHIDGKVIDSSEAGKPLQFIQGMGHIIPGLGKELYDMQIGDNKKVVVLAKDGYGEVDTKAFMDVPHDGFPTNVPLEKGTELELRDQSGQTMLARIDTINSDNIRLNMNHPLAGKELQFDVKITGLRPATEEEVSHGHVHDHRHNP